jgi:ornithine cyclodeaminase/alanine dehydrogenase-like protein (mu-crystallin family)
MIVLTENDLKQLVTPTVLVDAVQSAALAAIAGNAVVPPRLHVQWAPQRTLLAMPSAAMDATQGIAAMGTKLVSVVPDNAARGLPVTNGLMVISNWETGLPVAILNAATLTAQRTGAVGALGMRCLTPSHIDAIGIIGCGVQGTWQAIFACAVRPVRAVYFLSRSEESGARFESTVRAQVEWFSPECAARLQFKRCQDARDLIRKADLIVTATTSTEPVMPGEAQLLNGKHFIGIGSFRPDMQELPDAVCELAGSLVIDSEAARHETGDVLGPVSRGVLKTENVFHIGEVIAGRRVIDTERTTAYKSVGMALFDLYVATLFVEAAQRQGIGQSVAL